MTEQDKSDMSGEEELRCSKCGAVMAFKDTLTRDVPIAGVTFSVTMPGFECPVDGNTTFGSDVVRAMYERGARLVARHGPRTDKGFRYFRGKLGQTSDDLGSLLGVPRATIEGWEAGTINVDPLAWAVVAAMYLDQVGERLPMLELLRETLSEELRRHREIDLRGVAA